MDALKDLIHNQENINVLLTDKTNKICLLDKDLVTSKISDHLHNDESFIKLDSDPSPHFEQEANKLFLDCAVDAGIDTSSHGFRNMFTEYSSTPVLHPLANDHKPSFPNTKVRVVQPITNSAIEKMDLLVSKVLTQITDRLPNRVKSSQDFIAKMKSKYGNDIVIPQGCIQASFDVENMYPTMPKCEKALTILRGYLLKYDDIDLFGFNKSHIVEGAC